MSPKDNNEDVGNIIRYQLRLIIYFLLTSYIKLILVLIYLKMRNKQN